MLKSFIRSYPFFYGNQEADVVTMSDYLFYFFIDNNIYWIDTVL